MAASRSEPNWAKASRSRNAARSSRSRPATFFIALVSRVGGNAQTKAMKKVAGRLRLDLAAFRDLEAFAQFGSDLDAATQQQLNRGERLVATLNQPQYSPWPVEEQVVAIWSATNGHLDKIPVSEVQRFLQDLLTQLRGTTTVLDDIKTAGS